MGSIRLNKFIASCGVCTRREADSLISTSQITVNGKIVSVLGAKIDPNIDVVVYQGSALNPNECVFVLVNKPVGCPVLPSNSHQGIDALSIAQKTKNKKLFPIASIKNDDCGLVLFSDDRGFLSASLSRLTELIHITLKHSISADSFTQIIQKASIGEGVNQIIEIAYSNSSAENNELGVLMVPSHSASVRELFRSFGHDIVKYDRVGFAGLTKKDLPRGRSRVLSQKEVGFLKMKI